MVKNLTADAEAAGDMGLIPGSGTSPGNPLQYGNSKDRGAWWIIVHRVTKESDKAEHARTYVLYIFIHSSVNGY